MLIGLKEIIEYIGGVSDTAPEGIPIPLTSIWWGIWWAVLAAIIVVFSGQSSKFIYIDF